MGLRQKNKLIKSSFTIYNNNFRKCWLELSMGYVLAVDQREQQCWWLKSQTNSLNQKRSRSEQSKRKEESIIFVDNFTLFSATAFEFNYK